MAAAVELLSGDQFSRKRALALASYAEQCGRQEDMCDIAALISQVLTSEGQVMNHDERTLVAISFKSSLSSFRCTLKMLGLVAQHETHDVNLGAVFTYARRIEAGVLELAQRIMKIAVQEQGPLCEDKLGSAQSAQDSRAAAEAAIFFYKLAADYCRYVSECSTNSAVVAEHSDLALSYYSKARMLAASYLNAAHPTALGVVLNFSVFLFEIRHCEEEAYELAQAALEEAAAARASQEAKPADDDTAATVSSQALLSGPEQPLTAQEGSDSLAVESLIRENLRVWAQVLELSAAAGGR